MLLGLEIGDIVELKKQHPCGGKKFEVMRKGMDFRLKCTTCGSQIWITRPNLEKSLKNVIKSSK